MSSETLETRERGNGMNTLDREQGRKSGKTRGEKNGFYEAFFSESEMESAFDSRPFHAALFD